MFNSYTETDSRPIVNYNRLVAAEELIETADLCQRPERAVEAKKTLKTTL